MLKLKPSINLINQMQNDKVSNEVMVFDLKTDDEIKSIMGITKCQFNDLFNLIKSESNWNHEINLKYVLGIYLIRLRTGQSLKKLISIYKTSKSSQIYRFLNSLRSILDDVLVNSYLGFKNMSRGLLKLKHTSYLSNELFDVDEENILTIWDATYCYIEKSSCYGFQKATYSMHKGRNLVKMMMIVSSTGKFLK